MRNLIILLGVLSVFPILDLKAQEVKDKSSKVAPFATFKTTKLVNAPTSETHLKGDLNFLVSHRFGAIATGQGFHTLFGLDNARGLRIGLEYGITNDWDIGGSRSKGPGPREEIYEGFTKYRFVRQSREDGFPLTVTYYGAAALTGMESSSVESSPNAFTNFQQRFTYTHMAILSRRLGDRLSLALSPTFIHRNLVANSDQNNVYALGASATFKVTKTLSVIGEYFYHWPRERSYQGQRFQDPLGFGVEIETGGHVFQLTLNNAKGLSPSQFIPYSTAKWGDGAFRFGFSINRLFHL
jgi:hypothetical protein